MRQGHSGFSTRPELDSKREQKAQAAKSQEETSTAEKPVPAKETPKGE